MRNYLDLFNKDTIKARKELIKDLDESFRGVKVSSSNYGVGYIVSVKDYIINFNDDVDFKADIDFNGTIRTFCLYIAVEKNAITLEETFSDLLKEYLSSLETIFEERDRQFRVEAEKQALERKKLEEERAARKEAIEKAKKEKEEAEKLEKRKANAKQKFIDLCREAKKRGLTVDDEDIVIGWLAKHVTRISAEIPDFLESQFVANFGANAQKSVVSTAVKSSGGFTKKWSLSSTIHVDDLSTMPPVLKERFKDKKQINDVKFALNLIYNYGFTFGKTQDLDQIKSCAFDSKAFDLGFNA